MSDPSLPDLRWHGDDELDPGLVDLAVNVRLPAPPPWLAEVIAETIPGLGAYPDARRARADLAVHHRVDTAMVLPTAGGAEVFTLVARGLGSRLAAVVHPQFTEPEAALRVAGVPVEQIRLPPPFTLDPALVPDSADLVVVGNPTNPSGVLHAADVLRSLCRPGRVVLVDEAFMDAVPGETETMIGADMPGLLVARSLTKTWGLAGLRAGYVVGDADHIAALAEQQPHWSVSTPALAVMSATCSPRAVTEVARAAATVAEHRAYLVERLERRGLPVVGDPVTPFVLVDAGHRLGLRETLRTRGFAVRRCDTFPGLGPGFVRIAVREPAVTDALLRALG